MSKAVLQKLSILISYVSFGQHSKIDSFSKNCHSGTYVRYYINKHHKQPMRFLMNEATTTAVKYSDSKIYGVIF